MGLVHGEEQRVTPPFDYSYHRTFECHGERTVWMNDPRLQLVEWPRALNHVLDGLARTTHQEFLETRTDSGHVRRRPKTSPFPVFKGTVVLNESPKVALDQFFQLNAGRHFAFSNPRTGATAYATFSKAPFVRSTRIVVGAGTTYEIELVLRDTTDLIERALEQGVVEPLLCKRKGE